MVGKLRGAQSYISESSGAAERKLSRPEVGRLKSAKANHFELQKVRRGEKLDSFRTLKLELEFNL